MNYFRYFIYVSLAGLLLIVGTYFLKVNEGLRYVVNTKVSEALGVKVNVDKVNLKILENTVEIIGLKISNPTGFSSNYAAYVPKITAKFNIRDLMHKPILVNEINLFDPVVRLELNKLGNNLSSLRKNIPASASHDSSNGALKESEDKTEVAIKLITINNICLHADLGFISKDVKLRNISINGIENNAVIPYKVLIASVLENIISQALDNPNLEAQIFADLSTPQSKKEIRGAMKNIVVNQLKGQINRLFK